MIDITEHYKLIYKLTKEAGVPPEMYEDYIQDFYEYFLLHGDAYEPDKGEPTTFISLLFRNMLSRKALKFKALKRKIEGQEVSLEQELETSGHINTEVQGEGMANLRALENRVYCDEVVEMLPIHMRVKYLYDMTLKEIAQDKGVTQQRVAHIITQERKELKDRLK